MSEQNGGPAFPVPAEWTDHGMSLRDYFAAKAMQGMLSGLDFLESKYDDIARLSYLAADAMLEARKK